MPPAFVSSGRRDGHRLVNAQGSGVIGCIKAWAAGVILAASVAAPVHAQVAEVPAAGPAMSAMPSQDPPLSVMRLRGRAYWVSGGVSNTGFVVGDTGVIVIDAQMFTPAARHVLADIAEITPKPVNAVILTHSDPDHINGLPAYPRGIEIIAQEHAKAEIERVVADPHSNGTPPPPEIRDYIPTHAVRNSEVMVIDGVRLRLIHTSPAHTDGDLVIYLPDERVVFAGDLLSTGISAYPGIHLEKRGSSLGWLRSVRALLSLNADIFVSGHGGLMTRADVKAALRRAEQRRAEIKALVDKHMSLTEVRAASNDAPLPGLAGRFPTFVETTYAELAQPAK